MKERSVQILLRTKGKLYIITNVEAPMALAA